MPFIFVLSILSISVFATAFSPATGYSYDWQQNKTIKEGQYMDTLAGADSSTLLSCGTFEPGWTYIFRRGIISGEGSDSIRLQLVVDAYNGAKSFMERVVVDSLTAIASEQIVLPIYQTLFGSFFTIKVKAYADNGGEVILNNLYIDRVRIAK